MNVGGSQSEFKAWKKAQVAILTTYPKMLFVSQERPRSKIVHRFILHNTTHTPQHKIHFLLLYGFLKEAPVLYRSSPIEFKWDDYS